MAWWLVDSIINGTLDEDYPIMNKKDDVVTFGGTTIAGGEGTDTLDIKGARNVDWGDDGFSVTGNPNPSPDTISLNFSSITGSGVQGGAADTITFTGDGIGAADTITFYDRYGGYDPYPTLGAVDPVYQHHFPARDTISFGSTPSYEYGFPSKPQPDLKGSSHQKYQEDKGIAALKDYVASTYQGHYTNDNSDVQTLDLIHSVGDAESFCRSNAIKYLSRYDKKGQAKRDILKAMHYCLLLYYFSGHTNDEITTRGYETF